MDRHSEATMKNWLEPDADTRACIFDINTKAVDHEADGWTSVRKMVLSSGTVGSGYGLLTLAKEAAFEQHPTTRAAAKGLDRKHFREAHDLPGWMLERLAVHRIAPAGIYIPGIGKKWSLAEHASSGVWMIVDESPYENHHYTLEWNPGKETS